MISWGAQRHLRLSWILARVEVKPKGSNAQDKSNETAFIVCADSKDKN